MLEELREIDTTAVEKLVEVRKEQDRLLSFRRKADDMKDSVDEAIYHRVLADYEIRQSELDKEGEPLQAEAHSEYEKLCSIYDRIRGGLQQAQATKTELEFRHAVGEFDNKQLAERLAEPEGVLEKCKSQLAEVDELKAQFQAALYPVKEPEDIPRAGIGLDSRKKLDEQPEPELESRNSSEPSPDATPQPESNAMSAGQPKMVSENKPEAESRIEPELQAKVISKRKPEAESEVESRIEPKAKPGLQAKVISKSKPEAESKAESRVEPKAEPGALSKAGPKPESELGPEPEPQAPTPSAKIQDSDPSTDKTFIRPSSEAIAKSFAVPQAKLAILKGGRPTDEFFLGARNYIGRAVDNNIRIKSPAVSRKHALVTADATNFTLKDLGSLSGTYVNAKKVTKCTLADGDRIKVGDVELLFCRL